MKTVLLVEDDPVILRGLSENLEVRGFRVLSERDGKKGLQQALKSPPDLAILDIMLPSMNGIEICASLKRAGCDFPIFILTGLSAEAHRHKGLQHGADDYITKPFNVQELMLRVRNAILRSEQLGRRGKLVDEELQKAREIQVRSLPQSDPDIPGLDVHGRMIPASQVGGDYFDYITFAENKFCIIVADVSGKGMPAALYVQKMQGILQSSKDRISTAKNALLLLQKHLGSTIESSSFVTAVVAVFDIDKSVVEIVRAGHLPVLHKRGKKVQEIKPAGFWLGKSQDKLFEQSIQAFTMTMRRGDTFCFYTDGITESHNAQGLEFGISGLKKLFSSTDSGARKLVVRTFKAIDVFAGPSAPHDDKTLVVVRIKSLQREKP